MKRFWLNHRFWFNYRGCNYYYFVWMNFLKFLIHHILYLSLRNFIMKWSMQHASVFLLLLFSFSLQENYGYCVKKKIFILFYISRFYMMLLYYVVSYGICAVIFSQLRISTIPHSTLHACYFVELWSLRKELFFLRKSTFTRYST